MPLFIGVNYLGILSKSVKWNYIPRQKKFFSQTYCTTSQKLREKSSPVSFAEMLKLRMWEARSSILVQVQSSKSFSELYTYCNSFGKVTKMFHYSTGIDPLHFIIVQFNNEEEVLNILSNSAFVEEQQVVPVRSSFLWFSASHKKLPKHNKTIELSAENGTKPTSAAHITELLQSATNLSEQMKILFETTQLSDTGIRLRFLMAKQIQNAISGLFPYANVFPFGSTVNGYGKMECDLDVVLRLNDRAKTLEDSRLVFHSKASNGSERSTSQRHMESIGDIIQLFLPGCTQVRRILQARIPIIKYYQQLADVECDLSMANMSGVHMSDFLYMMGSFDERVRPLVFTVRKWAQSVGLTNSSPGRWITNFSLTLMVLAFLQKPLTSPPVLPSLNSLVQLAGSTDKYITEDGINCTFLRDISRITLPEQNTGSLESLLRQFYIYYSQFDFGAKAINLNEGVPVVKPEYSAIYIVNPLERGLNVSKNVSLEELDKFRLELRNAAWLLESEELHINRKDWGILSLFSGSSKTNSHVVGKRNGPRKLIDVSTLFEHETKGSSNVDVKNNATIQHIDQIKKETKVNIKKLVNVTSSRSRHNRRKLKG